MSFFPFFLCWLNSPHASCSSSLFTTKQNVKRGLPDSRRSFVCSGIGLCADAGDLYHCHVRSWFCPQRRRQRDLGHGLCWYGWPLASIGWRGSTKDRVIYGCRISKTSGDKVGLPRSWAGGRAGGRFQQGLELAGGTYLSRPQ